VGFTCEVPEGSDYCSPRAFNVSWLEPDGDSVRSVAASFRLNGLGISGLTILEAVSEVGPILTGATDLSANAAEHFVLWSPPGDQ
jgi:hypothetical protein